MSSSRINLRVKLQPRHLALAALCGAAFFVMAALAINFWMAGKWYLADVGNIQFCLINTWHGRFMWSPLAAVNHFALHFTPFLLLLSPIIWLSDYPIPLVLAYQLALALSPVPIFLLARQRGLPPVLALAAGFWFLCNHFVGSLQLANHFESFYVLFALGTMALLYQPGRHGWWICALATLSVKEDAAIWLLGFACWAALLEKDTLVRRRAVKLGGLCVAWGIAAGVIMLISARGQAMNSTAYLDRMGALSIGADNLWIFALLVASCGGLCLLNWRAALLLLIPVPMLLGAFPFTRNLLYYYSYPFLPFMAFATVAGLSQVWRWTSVTPAARRPAVFILTLALVALGIYQYILPTRTDGYKRLPIETTSRDAMRRRIASAVLPQHVPLALQFGLWGVTPWRADTVFLNSDQPKDRHYVFMDLRGVHGLTPEENDKVLRKLRADVEAGRRRQLYDAYDFVILSPATP